MTRAELKSIARSDQSRGGDAVDQLDSHHDAALLTFLPVYLARDMGHSVLDRCQHIRPQAAGLLPRPIAGHLSAPSAAAVIAQHVDDGGRAFAMIFAGGTIWFVVASRCWDFPVCRPPCSRPGC